MKKKLLELFGGSAYIPIIYRVTYAFCLIVHSFYAILFGAVGVRELMLFNIGSSIMYLVGLIFFVKNSNLTVLWLLLMYFEIVLHGLLCSYFLGFDYLFTLFSLAVIPVSYLLTYLDPNFKHPILISSVLAAGNGSSMLYILYHNSIVTPVYSYFPLEFKSIIGQLNLFIGLLIMVSFSILFIGKIGTDVSALKSTNEKLDYLANYDQLTGLRNRSHIRDIFDAYIKSIDPYCVILGDIDDFKHVNDTFGHSAGDAVLKTVSSIIKKNVGDKGEVCRWGGEEILILIKGSTDECLKINQNILRDIRNTTVESGGRSIKVTMTFGLCDYGDAMNMEKLISLSDKRLYIGKKSGKNQIVYKS